MEILRKTPDGYQWKKLTPREMFEFNDTETGYITVRNDDRWKYSRCTRCGAVMRNNKVAAHVAKHNMSSCLKCPHFMIGDTEIKKRKIKQNDDGTYAVHQTGISLGYCAVVSMRCGYRNVARDIHDTPRCRYNCVGADIARGKKTYLTEHPGLFDVVLTEKSVMDGHWHLYNGSGNSSRTYQHNTYSALRAQFDSNGILTKFIISTRSNCFYFRYSVTYREYVNMSFRDMKKFDPTDSVRHWSAIDKIITKLYQEA